MNLFNKNMMILTKLNKIASKKPFERPSDANNLFYRKKLSLSQHNIKFGNIANAAHTHSQFYE